MDIPQRFDNIRPYTPEELPAAYDKLAADPFFPAIAAYVLPGVPSEKVSEAMHACRTSLEFQKVFCHPFLKRLEAKATKGCSLDHSAIDKSQRHTFVSNHRDIVIDSAFLSMLLIDSGFDTTCEIAIGDNLLSLPWVETLVRINKSFRVERGLTPSAKLQSAQALSAYMHFAIAQKGENLWIAQSEGRCKDSDDRTQTAVLKMLAMEGEGPVEQRLAELNIVPLSISYEYDPCDYLKAAELQRRRDDPGFKKAPGEDEHSMLTGVTGYKGEVHYHMGGCINPFLEIIPTGQSRNATLAQVAAHIDRVIHSNYRLYPGNYVALDLLNGSTAHAAHYTAEQKEAFESYIAGQMAKIAIPEPDTAFLRRSMLLMYANPAANHLAAIA